MPPSGQAQLRHVSCGRAAGTAAQTYPRPRAHLPWCYVCLAGEPGAQRCALGYGHQGCRIGPGPTPTDSFLGIAILPPHLVAQGVSPCFGYIVHSDGRQRAHGGGDHRRHNADMLGRAHSAAAVSVTPEVTPHP